MRRIASFMTCLTALAFTTSARAQQPDTATKVTGQTTSVEHSSRTTTTSNMAGRGHHPKGATAKCTDGSYSMSTSTGGTCSGHGGVAKWYAKARCTDGTLWMHRSKRGACSGHQGVAEWIKKNESTK